MAKGQASQSNASPKHKCLGCLKQQMPLIVVLAALVAGALAPHPGAVGYKYSKFWLIAMLFVCTGFNMKIQELAKGLAAVHVHLICQFYSLVFVPLSYYALVYRWQLTENIGALSHEMAVGVMAAMVMPTTTNTNILWTGFADGDVSIAAVNAVVGNIIGAFIAPLMASALIGASSQSNIGQTMWSMTKQIVFPFFIGIALQLILRRISDQATTRLVPWSKRCLELILVAITYFMFSAAFDEGAEGLDAISLLLMVFWILLLHLIYLAGAWIVSCKFDMKTRVAFTITASQKTENMAVAILAVIFGSKSGVFALPVVAYHSIQMIVAAFICPTLKAKVAQAAAREASNEANSCLTDDRPSFDA